MARACWLLLTLFLAGCGLLGSTAQPEGEAPAAPALPEARVPSEPEAECRLAISSARPRPAALWGFSADLRATPLAFDNPALDEALRPLAPGLLAYPGGLAANAWDWMLGIEREEWFPPQWLDESGRPLPGPRRALEWNLRKGGMQFRDFFETCRVLGAEPLCMANVLHQEPGDSVAWLRAAERHRVRPRYWELGHGLGGASLQAGGLDPESLLERAAAHAAALHAADEELRVGLPVPLRGLLEAGRGAEALRERAWVAVARQRDFYDAVALRLRVDLAGRELDRDPVAVWHDLLRFWDTGLVRVLDRAGQLFPGRGLWVTELEPGLEGHEGLEGGALHGLALADLVLTLCAGAPELELMVVAPLERALPLSNRLELEAQLVERARAGDGIAATGDLEYRLREFVAPRQALAMLADFFAPSVELLETEWQARPRLDGDAEAPPALVALAGRDAEGRVRLLALNRLARPLPLALRFNDKPLSEKIRQRSLILEQPSLVSLSEQTERLRAHELELPPLSLSLLELGIP